VNLLNKEETKQNLIAQLTDGVKWAQYVQAMIADHTTKFTECGFGKVLQRLMLKINNEVIAESIIR
jgi:[acyl-carrier-protein] S-malonyltransferase